jgi:DNA-binding XRE family transcriptional regulator
MPAPARFGMLPIRKLAEGCWRGRRRVPAAEKVEMMQSLERSLAKTGADGSTKLALRKYAISAAQCRAARALLGWTQKTLAERAGLARKTVTEFEAGSRSVQFRSRRDIALAFEQAGIEFIWKTDTLLDAERTSRGGEGVRRIGRET